MGFISEEMFKDMLAALDADGDGTVSKDEFKFAFIGLHVQAGKAKPSDAEYEATWKKIDKDGDGTLSVDELAAHFGFDLSKKEGSDEMTEEQILSALSMQSFLFDEVFTKLSKESTGRRKSVELMKVPKPVGPKQMRQYLGFTTIKVPSTMPENIQDPKLAFLFACECGDKREIRQDWLETEKLDRETIYIEDDKKGETPLMKMCRHPGMINEIRDILAIVGQSQLEDCPKYYINLQDGQGKSAPFYAAEYGQVEVLELLITRGADVMQTNNNGWTFVHQAVSAAKTEKDSALLEAILTHEKVQPKKAEVISARDGQGRMPIHIASFKGIDSITQLLLKHGADPTAKDGANIDSIGLAERAGRRTSKEILEEFVKNDGMTRSSAPAASSS